MNNRIAEIRFSIQPSEQRGLEIGPLDKPIVKPTEGDIAYVDHLSTEDLRIKYQNDPNVNCTDIVEVTYIWGERTLAEAVGKTSIFDYVIASHVIEHVPDLIGWLQEVTEVLKPGGVLSLAIPDKRYCFDYLRNLSTAGDAIDAYMAHRRRPSVRHVFDHYSTAVVINTSVAWAGGIDVCGLQHYSSHTDAWQLAKRADEGEYIDAHVWVFTPDSFNHLLNIFRDFNLVSLTQTRLVPTANGTLEFFVVLKKCT